MTLPCEAIAKQMGALYRCEPLGEYTRIETPYRYPDGDAIDIFFQARQGRGLLTDLGEAMQWLGMQTATQKRSPKQMRLIHDTCDSLKVQFQQGTLSLDVQRLDTELAEAVTRLAQAMLHVADLWFTFRVREFESVADEVEEFLKQREIQFERGEKIEGASKRVWSIDFHTRTHQRESLVCVLSTGSKAAARAVSEHVTATWYDLRNLRLTAPAIKYVSLFDDTADVWAPEDFRLVQDLSEIARWSQPDDFAERLAA